MKKPSTFAYVTYLWLKIAAAFFVFGQPANMIYGWIDPWDAAKAELGKYENSLVLLTGFSYWSRSASANSKAHSSKTISYLVIDPMSGTSKRLSVQEDSVRGLNIATADGGGVWYLLIYLACCYLFYAFWFKGFKPTKIDEWLKRVGSFVGVRNVRN